MADKKIKLELWRSSWVNFFDSIYHKNSRVHRVGNFWEALQFLQQQFEEQTGHEIISITKASLDNVRKQIRELKFTADYIGAMRQIGNASVEVKYKKLNSRRTVFLKNVGIHTDKGFHWGTDGTQAADLALSILQDFFTRIEIKDAENLARVLHQRFKVEMIAKIKGDLHIDERELYVWLHDVVENK